jgi:chaperonin cofactor prefoldin
LDLNKKSKKELVELLKKAIETMEKAIEESNNSENSYPMRCGRMEGELEYFLKNI